MIYLILAGWAGAVWAWNQLVATGLIVVICYVISKEKRRPWREGVD